MDEVWREDCEAAVERCKYLKRAVLHLLRGGAKRLHGRYHVARDAGDGVLEVIRDAVQDPLLFVRRSGCGLGDVAAGLVGDLARGVGLPAFGFRDFEGLSQGPDEPAECCGLHDDDQAVEQHTADIVAVQKDACRLQKAEEEMMSRDRDGGRDEDAPVEPAGEHGQHGEEVHVHVGLIGVPGKGVDQQHDLAKCRDAGDLPGGPTRAIDTPRQSAERGQRRPRQNKRSPADQRLGERGERQKGRIDPQEEEQQAGEMCAKPGDVVHRLLHSAEPTQSRARPASITSQAPA